MLSNAFPSLDHRRFERWIHILWVLSDRLLDNNGGIISWHSTLIRCLIQMRSSIFIKDRS